MNGWSSTFLIMTNSVHRKGTSLWLLRWERDGVFVRRFAYNNRMNSQLLRFRSLSNTLVWLVRRTSTLRKYRWDTVQDWTPVCAPYVLYTYHHLSLGFLTRPTTTVEVLSSCQNESFPVPSCYSHLCFRHPHPKILLRQMSLHPLEFYGIRFGVEFGRSY